MNTYFRFAIFALLLLLTGSLGNHTFAQELPFFDSIFQATSALNKVSSTVADTPERTTLREGTFQNAVGSAHAISGR